MPIRPLESTALRLTRGPSAAPALVIGQTAIDHGELRDRVDARRHELGAERRLVMIAAANEVEPIVTYLAALEGGHPVLFVDGDPASNRRHREALIERFDPDVIADGSGGREGATRWALTERRDGTRHELHPELALLASTSGSTGSPKLVRLSRANVESNAVAIADYLNLGVADRAVTTLPLHYCYGLSVVNSHLVAGGSVALQSHSVVDDEFWRVFDDVQATSFAGVPYTFDLLDAAGFADRSTPSLRYVTQAGGRLDPERVRSYARLGRDRGFEFVVMYGQTEATARMAYLPPSLAESAVGAIGVPIPGGRFRIDDPRDDGVGELVYSGPNVMLGYAEEPADFASGRVVDELCTGDLARRRDDGLYEIVGRSSRFVKVFGLRIDLDRVEQLLAGDGFEVRAASSDERLLLFVRAERLVDAVRERASAHTGLPAHMIRVHAIEEFPRTSSGKPDTAALVRYAADLDACAESAADGMPAADGTPAAASDTAPDAVRLLYTALLGRTDVTLDDSFSGLGGDSLSYVEVSLRLEALLGALPREWPTMTVRELGALVVPEREEPEPAAAGAAAMAATPVTPAPVSARAAPRRRLPRVETPAVLRAVAILLIVGTHANLFDVKGGAHLLLAVAGYNLARFQLADVAGRSRSRSLLRSTGQLLVPAVLWVGAVALVSGYYRPETVLFVNNFGGDSTWSVHWQFWFIEAVAWSLLGLAALLAVPGIDRLERRHPYAFAVGVLAVALVARTLLLGGVEAHATERYTTAMVVWCLALGWLIARSRTLTQRWVATAVAIASVAGFFGTPSRELVIVAGLLLLIWLPAVPLPRLLVPLVGVLAGASMFIYLTHWQVYPSLENHVPWLATLLSLAVGVVAWKLYSLASSRLTAMGRARRRRRRAPRP
ncbi:AMP-binding protein [Agromyces subbeticus]|uniref:AMP-binding protein n=1 Tax=Agromyces subbeticus TaxID=293890 RepID=UPI0003B4F644|nr:AMP-binding protein [Agromyces subbeticus]